MNESSRRGGGGLIGLQAEQVLVRYVGRAGAVVRIDAVLLEATHADVGVGAEGVLQIRDQPVGIGERRFQRCGLLAHRARVVDQEVHIDFGHALRGDRIGRGLIRQELVEDERAGFRESPAIRERLEVGVGGRVRAAIARQNEVTPCRARARRRLQARPRREPGRSGHR